MTHYQTEKSPSKVLVTHDNRADEGIAHKSEMKMCEIVEKYLMIISQTGLIRIRIRELL